MEAGESYATLADWINDKLATYLFKFWQFHSSLRGIDPRYWSRIYQRAWEEDEPDPDSFELASKLLQSLGMKEDEAEQILNEGLERIRYGNHPFEHEYPISRNKMINTLRTWREGRKHKLINSLRREQDSDPGNQQV